MTSRKPRFLLPVRALQNLANVTSNRLEHRNPSAEGFPPFKTWLSFEFKINNPNEKSEEKNSAEINVNILF